MELLTEVWSKQGTKRGSMRHQEPNSSEKPRPEVARSKRVLMGYELKLKTCPKEIWKWKVMTT